MRSRASSAPTLPGTIEETEPIDISPSPSPPPPTPQSRVSFVFKSSRCAPKPAFPSLTVRPALAPQHLEGHAQGAHSLPVPPIPRIHRRESRVVPPLPTPKVQLQNYQKRQHAIVPPVSSFRKVSFETPTERKAPVLPREREQPMPMAMFDFGPTEQAQQPRPQPQPKHSTRNRPTYIDIPISPFATQTNAGIAQVFDRLGTLSRYTPESDLGPKTKGSDYYSGSDYKGQKDVLPYILEEKYTFF